MTTTRSEARSKKINTFGGQEFEKQYNVTDRMLITVGRLAMLRHGHAS